jgi:hypothetical protein
MYIQTALYRIYCTLDVLYSYNHLNRMKTNGMRGISLADFHTYVSLVM